MRITINRVAASFVVCIAAIQSCNHTGNQAPPAGFRALLPSYIKDSIYLSGNNPFSEGKARLGRYFFYDRRMSFNQTKSCSSCHDQKFSFTDGYRRSIGALGDNVRHNAVPLLNIVFNKYLTLADSSLHFPEQQVNNPMFHDQPIELGWKGNETMMLERFEKDNFYRQQMKMVFQDDSGRVTIKNIQSCISSFVKTIVSFNSAYDRYTYRKDTGSLTAMEKRGMNLFFSSALACSSCHGGSNFSVPAILDSSGQPAYYQNTGLYNTDGKGAYPAYDQGLFQFTRNTKDMGKYRIPSLRNLAFTAPYFHDGSAASLEEVIALYEEGGRNQTSGAYKGDGRKNPYKNHLINGIRLTSQERRDLISFLLSLSDSSVCNNPLYANPFKEDETKK